VSEIACPHCGRLNDCHDEVTDPAAAPKAGDMAICWSCGGVAVFTGSDGQRKPTEAELADIMANPRIRQALAAIAESFTPHQAISLTRSRP